MYLARTTVRTAHVLKWRQNRHERCLIEFVYFTFSYIIFAFRIIFMPSTSHANSYVTHSVFGCGNQMQINDGKPA